MTVLIRPSAAHIPATQREAWLCWDSESPREPVPTQHIMKTQIVLLLSQYFWEHIGAHLDPFDGEMMKDCRLKLEDALKRSSHINKA